MLNPFTNRRLARNGEAARAWITRMPAPLRGSGPQSVAMTLDVERADGARYEVRGRWMLAAGEPLTVGSELRVRVDPERKSRLAIDWEETREIHRRKAAERRDLLSVGVAVPVAKLHHEARERGLIDPPQAPPPAAPPAAKS